MMKHSLPCYMLNPFRYQIETACECHSEKYHVTLSHPHLNRVRHFRRAGWYGDAIHIFFLGLFCVCIFYTCNIGKHMITLKYTVPFLYILAILQDTRTDCLLSTFLSFLCLVTRSLEHTSSFSLFYQSSFLCILLFELYKIEYLS